MKFTAVLLWQHIRSTPTDQQRRKSDQSSGRRLTRFLCEPCPGSLDKLPASADTMTCRRPSSTCIYQRVSVLIRCHERPACTRIVTLTVGSTSCRGELRIWLSAFTHQLTRKSNRPMRRCHYKLASRKNDSLCHKCVSVFYSVVSLLQLCSSLAIIESFAVQVRTWSRKESTLGSTHAQETAYSNILTVHTANSAADDKFHRWHENYAYIKCHYRRTASTWKSFTSRYLSYAADFWGCSRRQKVNYIICKAKPSLQLPKRW